MTDATLEPGTLVECIKDDWFDFLEEGYYFLDRSEAPKVGDRCSVTDVQAFETLLGGSLTFLTLRGYPDDFWFWEAYFKPVEGGTMEVLRKAARSAKVKQPVNA